jgi:hypothetical protein
MDNILETLKTAPHEQIPEIAHEKFVSVYSQKFGPEKAEAFFEEQKNLFINELVYGSYKDFLKQADGMSIYFAFLFLAINGLSLEKGTTTTCYLECRRVKIGEDPNRRNAKGYPEAIYQSNAVITITGYGEIILRQRAKQIRSVDSPKVVYDCDTFRYGENDGHPTLTWEKCLPRPQGSRIVACYVRIIKNDGSVDYFVLDTDEIQRLKQYSGKSNWGKANALYGKEDDCSDIDTGFLKSKTVKHAFKGYPKLSIGAGGAFESDKDIDPTEPMPESHDIQTDNNDDDPFNK